MTLCRSSGWLSNHLKAGVVLTTLMLPALAVLLALNFLQISANADVVAGSATTQTDGVGTSQASLPTVFAGSPLASSVLDSDMNLHATRATAWKDGDVQMILLEREVSFSIGTYGFSANTAVVRIENEPAVGKLVHHVWIYLDQARPMQGRGPLQGQAGRLLVTTSTTGDISLLTDLLKNTKPQATTFIDQAQRRFAQYAWSASQQVLPVPPGKPLVPPQALAMREQRRAELAAVAQRYRAELPPKRLAQLQREEARPSQSSATTQPQGQGSPLTIADAQGLSSSPTAEGSPPQTILPTQGTVLFQYDRVAVQPMDNGELAIVFMGHVSVIYQPVQGQQGMSLSATNAVVFVKRTGTSGSLPDTRMASAKDVRGIYLEDNVEATNGQFTVRAPRVYYDLSRNKAVVLDAVMYAYDVKRHLPIYIRAQKLRQESLQSWTAHNATLTTSDFANPSIALAAREITFQQQRGEEGEVHRPFVAKGAAVKVGGLPVFAWPRISGDASSNIPLRSVNAGYRSKEGPFIQTKWDLFSLAGRPKPEGVDLTGLLDYRGERGPAVGVEMNYDLPRMFGNFQGYLLAYDQGEDRIGGREDIGHDGDARGYYSFRHRQIIQGGWELSLESQAATDPTFLEDFFPEEATSSKPWETSVYLKKQQDDWAFTFLGAYDFNDFTPQTTTLQAPGYRVQKLPELGYYRVGTSFWEDRLTYYSQTTVSRMRLEFGSDKPSDRGFSNAQSQINFGIPNTTAFGDAFRAQGLDNGWRTRFDTRHEINAPMKWGIIDAVPYISARLTAYDDDFKEYGGEGDNVRFFGTTGLRLHSQFHRTYDDVDSRLLNVHRMRHIFEPTFDVNYAGSTYNPEAVPVYDPDVEALQEGTSFKFGFRNTLQTQRGGPGRWRNVDWLVLNTDFVVRSNDANPAPIPQYYSYRPEYGLGGDHFHTDLMWMVSDTLAAVGELNYDFENRRVAYWRLGATMEHTPALSSFLEYSEIPSMDSRLLSMGLNYKLTSKWSAGVRYTFDLAGNKTRDIDLTMVRDMSDWKFAIMVSEDALDNRQTISVMLMPNFVHNASKLKLFGPVLAK